MTPKNLLHALNVSPRRHLTDGRARQRRKALCSGTVERLEDRRLMAVLTVNTTADNTDRDDLLTLREAIYLINDPSLVDSVPITPGERAQISGTLGVPGIPDVIDFALADDDPRHFYYQNDGVSSQVAPSLLVSTTSTSDSDIHDIDPDYPHSFWSILISTPLPTITNSVTIDGYSQRGATANTSVTEMNAVLPVNVYGLVGSGQTSSRPASAFTIAGDDSVIRGLDITGFGQAIQILGGTNNRVQGNIIGCDPSQLQASVGVFQGNPVGASVLIAGGGTRNVFGVDGDGQDYLSERNLLIFGTLNIDGVGTNDNVVAGNLMRAYSHIPGNSDVLDTTMIRIGGGAQRNRVGTNGDGTSDILERNTAGAVLITGSGTDENVVAGNYLGVDPTGTEPELGYVFGVGSAGDVDRVRIEDGAAWNRIGADGSHVDAGAEGNVIAAGPVGVDISSSSYNWVTGNIVGLDATGTHKLIYTGSPGNPLQYFRMDVAGVRVLSGMHNTIGTDGDGVGDTNERNVIAAVHCVELLSSDDNIIAGNLIGTDITGTIAEPDFDPFTDGGIYLLKAHHNRIGTNSDGVSDAAERNVLGGLLFAVVTGDQSFDDPSASDDNTIAGNSIGTDASGTLNLGNWGGIGIGTYSHSLIGGTAPGAGNLIAFNRNTSPGTSARVEARRNSFYSNGPSWGVNPKIGGPFPGDPENAPLLTSVTTSAGQTTIRGIFSSVPNRNATIEFFASDRPNPSGYGDGKRFLGDLVVTTAMVGDLSPDSAGNRTFSVTFDIGDLTGEFVTATATSAQSGTSHFSPSLAVGGSEYRLSSVQAYFQDLVTILQSVDTAVSPTIPGMVFPSTPYVASSSYAEYTNFPVTINVDPSKPHVDITIDYTSGTKATYGRIDPQDGSEVDSPTYWQMHISVPAGMTLTLTSSSGSVTIVDLVVDSGDVVIGSGVTLEGRSPALIVNGGTVAVQDGARLTTETDSPTVIVNGGTLTVRGSTITQNSSTSASPAIAVNGGAVDLGTASDPGGNLINVNGTGSLIAGVSNGVFSAVGDTFALGGTALTDPFLIDDRITVTGGGTATVMLHPDEIIVGPTGDLQGAITQIPNGGTVLVAGTSYPAFLVGSKPLTVSFRNGPTITQRPDPLYPGTTELVVSGTPGDDKILFNPGTKAAGDIDVAVNKLPTGTFHPTARIIAHGGAGNDDIQVAGGITLPAWLYGDDGNDRLKGGSGNNVILGGTGDDLLVGGSSRDILIGGTGADRIVGNEADDILIAGYTSYDAVEAALAEILAEWASARDYATRVANLKGTGTGPRANGSTFLITDGAGATVYDDGVVDVLTGDTGQDWFLFNVDGDGDPTKKDKVTDLTAQEFASDLDFITGP